ncbi:hypothetical protein LCGC14_3115830, partial [marine sediment metagenome]
GHECIRANEICNYRNNDIADIGGISVSTKIFHKRRDDRRTERVKNENNMPHNS